jgi:lysozyme
MTNPTSSPQISIAVSILKIEEGYRATPYLCSEGYPTIGIGQRIGSKGTPLSAYEFTCSESLSEQWLSETITNLDSQLNEFDWYQVCNSERKAILISMAYQLGMHGLLQFKHFLASLVAQQWKDASKHGLDSLWDSQAPSRAQKHMSIIEHGFIGEVY